MCADAIDGGGEDGSEVCSEVGGYDVGMIVFELFVGFSLRHNHGYMNRNI